MSDSGDDHQYHPAYQECDEEDVMYPAWQTMKMHPKYFKAFTEVQHCLLNGSGPLNSSKRKYIAMMASSRHWCTELISTYSRGIHSAFAPPVLGTDDELAKFLKSELNLKEAPAKIRQLDKINQILAHRPWMITKYHIRELCVKSEENGWVCWSLSEVIQAIVLLVHFHASSSFVLGCGIVNDDDEGTAASKDDEDPSDAALDDKVPVTVILEKLETLGAQAQEPIDLDELTRRFEKVEKSLTQDIPLGGGGGGKTARSRSHTPDPAAAHDDDEPTAVVPSKFTNNLSEFQYVDFLKREDAHKYPTLKSFDFCWEEQGFMAIEKLYNEEMSRKLDDKFKTIDSLTYRTIGSFKDKDTSLFRRAIHCYVQCLYGIRHDDYNYGLINELLPRRLKKYIKTVSCYPERCTKEEYRSIMTDFLGSEKVHVCLLVCEARYQSELLYACKAISEFYMDKNC